MGRLFIVEPCAQLTHWLLLRLPSVVWSIVKFRVHCHSEKTTADDSVRRTDGRTDPKADPTLCHTTSTPIVFLGIVIISDAQGNLYTLWTGLGFNFCIGYSPFPPRPTNLTPKVARNFKMRDDGICKTRHRRIGQFFGNKNV